ncbi:hypothetical protein BUE80_DR013451 [Diplocarpon rosae]|nr:hypothetical protein BUE80_DR013451 [Diplocarpon rosae]
MAPQPSTEEADAHQALLEQLDIHSIPKPFRNHAWKPNQRRNKNIKTILGDASAPSMAHTKHYCDITGLGAPYTDPKTRLRFHNKEVFGVIRGLGQGVAEQYLEARGAHTVLK